VAIRVHEMIAGCRVRVTARDVALGVCRWQEIAVEVEPLREARAVQRLRMTVTLSRWSGGTLVEEAVREGPALRIRGPRCWGWLPSREFDRAWYVGSIDVPDGRAHFSGMLLY